MPINNPPVIGGDGNTVDYTEQASAVTLDSNLTVSDADSPTLAGATVSISSGFTSGDILQINGTFSGVIDNGANGSINYSFSGSTLTLTGTDTPADYQAALQLVTFQNPTNDSSNARNLSRTITWQANDGSNLSNQGTTTVTVASVDDPPVIAINNGTTPNYTEGGAPVTAAPNATLTDPDNFYFSSMTIRILDFQPGDVLDVPLTGIAARGSYDPTTGVFTIPVDGAIPGSSFDTINDYLQGIIRQLTYSSTSADPTNGGAHTTRTLEWQIHDASAATGTTPLFQAPVGYATGAGTGPVALSNMFRDAVDTDVNSDLQTDLITADAGSGQVSVLINHNGDGTFTSPTGPFAAGANASSVAAADFNEDIDLNNLFLDRMDVIVGHSTGNTLSLLLGDGNGHFAAPTSITVGNNPQFVLLGDFNGDGHDDLAVANGGDSDIMLLYGRGDGTFQSPMTLPSGADANANPIFIATGEFNAPVPNPPPQGPDFAIANRGDDSVTIYQGDGQGNFTRRPDILLPSGSEPVAIATGEFNGDLTTDLAIADYGTNTIALEIGNGDGTFTPGPVLNTVGLHPTSIIAQDVDGNGRQDLIVTDAGDAGSNIDGDVEIFLVNPDDTSVALADGTFQPPIVLSLPSGAHPTSVRTAEFNLDGNPDLAVTDPSTNNVYVLLHTKTTASAAVQSTINVSAVNNAPAASVPNTAYNATERTDLALQGTGLSVSDPDGNTGTETVTLSVGEGTITVTAGNSNISNLNNNGSGNVSFDGTLAELNALLSGASTGTVVYNDPSHTPVASTMLTLQIDDNGHTGGSALTTSTAQTINITAVNEAPVASAPASYPSVAEGVALPLHNASLNVSDADGGTAGENETATLSVNAGRLHAVAGTGASSGVQISGDGTKTLTITGTLAQINGLLNSDATSILTFTGNVDANDTPSSVTLSLSINDNGFTGGAPLTSNTAQATITPAPDDTTVSFTGLSGGSTGSPVEGRQISAIVHDDGQTVSGVTFTWKAGGNAVGSGSTYTPGEADEGLPLTLDVSFTDPGDSSVNESNAGVAVGSPDIVQENPNENASFTVSGLVNGHLVPNQQLTATVTETDAPTSGITYTWQVDGVTRKTGVDSAGNTFTPVLGDESKTLSVSVSFTDTHGFAEAGTQIFNRPNASYDVNGDNISDLVFLNNGQPGIWLWNGAAPTAEAVVNSAGGASWHVVTSRDMNGDAKSDLIWQNNDGTPGIWLMNGTTPLAELALTNPGANWRLVAAGDVNGDANADLIWQDAGGTLGVWEMNGTTPIAKAAIGNPGSTWKVVGSADFDHDGRDDILLQNTATGNLMIDLMNGTTVASSVSITVGDPSWHAIGTGVFNGVTEIAWQNNSGTPGIWLMNGTTPGAEAALTNPGAGWQLVAMDHFTPDGKADLLFQNTSGPMMLWQMNGTSVAAMVNLQTPGPGWQSVNGHPFATG